MYKALREKVHQKYKGRCAYCGVEIAYDQMHVDHIIPKRNFNTKKYDYSVDDIRNLNPSCFYCNNWKGTFSVDEFRGELHKQAERVRRDSAGFRLMERYGLVKVLDIHIIFFFELFEDNADVDTEYEKRIFHGHVIDVPINKK